MLKITSSIIRVAERALRFVGTPLPTDVEERIRLVCEMRALRVWEEFDEGIIRWSLRINQVAVATDFGACRIELSPISRALPAKALLVVDEIYNAMAGAVIDGAIGAVPTGIISLAPPDFSDMRWGPKVATPPLSPLIGSNPAQTGDLIIRIPAGARLTYPGMFIAQTPSSSADDGNALTLWTGIINTLFLAYVQGRIIIPR